MDFRDVCNDGDLLFRAGVEEWIMELTDGRYSHAGICTAASTSTAVHAHPTPTDSDIESVQLDDFFSTDHAPGGGAVSRYGGSPDHATMAASWASRRIGDPYEFNMMDPILGPVGARMPSPDRGIYCSAFVWWAFSLAAGIDLVPIDEFFDLFSNQNRERSMRILCRQQRKNDVRAKALSDSKLRARIESMVATRPYVRYVVTPEQLANSPKAGELLTVEAGTK